jgi:hypothetical protein
MSQPGRFLASTILFREVPASESLRPLSGGSAVS